jgi:hypothetical protein
MIAGKALPTAGFVARRAAVGWLVMAGFWLVDRCMRGGFLLWKDLFAWLPWPVLHRIAHRGPVRESGRQDEVRGWYCDSFAKWLGRFLELRAALFEE